VTASDAVAQAYRQFEGYSWPTDLWVCEQCGPEWSADDLRATPLHELTLPQLVAVHVMSLDDGALRYVLPRLLELLLTTPAPVFDFRMSDLAHRLPSWRPDEQAAVRRFAGAVWFELLAGHPAELGYFCDVATALELLEWCGLPVIEYLDVLRASDAPSAALHLADLVDAVCTTREPFESVSRATVFDWLRDAATGDRLEQAFFVADSPETARRLSSAHDMWAVCCR
jgi:hypothetical protein